jgi:glucosamine-phosphate N-acetyltransferase
MLIRELKVEDMPRFVEIVKQLSPEASLGVLTDRSAWYNICRMQNKRVFVAEIDSKVVGTASVLLEDKINRGTSEVSDKLYCVAHIEEVVVDEAYRGQDIGLKLMEYCVNYAKLAEAYKVILDCSEENVPFYEKCGMKRYEVSMRLDL